MKKLLGAIAGLFATAAIIAGIVAIVDPVQAASCTNGTKYTDFNGSRTGRDTLTVWPKAKLCKDAKVNFTTFKVLNKNYNGKPFKNNPTALPQASIWNKTVTLKKGSTSKVTVKMGLPDACTPYQIDAYVGPVQTKVTTSKGLANTTAIVAKLFDKTKSDCTKKVCNPATGQIITVHENDAHKYKPVNDPACKKVEMVKACNTETGIIEDVEKGKENTPPYTTDMSKCKKVQVCNTETGELEWVLPSKANTPPYTTVLSECEEVEMVKACNTETGIIEDVEKGKENTPPYTTDMSKCKKVQVCNTETGELEWVLPSKANTPPYTTELSECEEVEMVKACNTETGIIEDVEKGKENTPPYTTDMSKCKKVQVCNTETGELEWVLPSKANTPPYTTVLSECEEVEMVKACNTETGIIEDVEKGKENTPPYTTDMDKCKVEVCDESTGETKLVPKADEDKYAPKDSEKCNPKPPVPPKPPVTPETPEELPVTGSAQALSAVLGLGAIAGTTASYVRSRRNLQKQ